MARAHIAQSAANGSTCRPLGVATFSHRVMPSARFWVYPLHYEGRRASARPVLIQPRTLVLESGSVCALMMERDWSRLCRR
jgi:hypothetical protein